MWTSPSVPPRYFHKEKRVPIVTFHWKDKLSYRPYQVRMFHWLRASLSAETLNVIQGSLCNKRFSRVETDMITGDTDILLN